MNLETLKNLIEKKYELEVKTLEKVKNTYKINGDDGFCLKVVGHDLPHFKFIIKGIKHLEQKGFDGILNIIETRDKKDFISFENKNCFLTKWIRAKESNFDDIEMIEKISTKISEMHLKSRGFILGEDTRPRIYWGSWIKVFQTRRDEMFDFKLRIERKAYKSDFDKMFLENFNKEIERANKSIERLKKSSYIEIMRKDAKGLGFCHHDLANHNILIGEDGIKFIDFDYCILDSGIHDLASFIWRVNKFNENPSRKKIDSILEGYQKNIDINAKEKDVMREFLSFPQEFWQIGLQVYWEMRPWGEDFMLKKLEKYFSTLEMKKEIISLI
ncbi:MAG: CotS family spore coat protein [Clostridium sp.]|uniref:CotS family spore coat protein n=1 Tax=Clostridium sp. TaxID=1506 RepID=UPI003F34CDF2